jgi:WD40 repeat protein
MKFRLFFICLALVFLLLSCQRNSKNDIATNFLGWKKSEVRQKFGEPSEVIEDPLYADIYNDLGLYFFYDLESNTEVKQYCAYTGVHSNKQDIVRYDGDVFGFKLGDSKEKLKKLGVKLEASSYSFTLAQANQFFLKSLEAQYDNHRILFGFFEKEVVAGSKKFKAGSIGNIIVQKNNKNTIVIAGGGSVPEMNNENQISHGKEEWKQKTLNYVQAVNSYVEKGHRLNWKDVGKEPDEPNLEHLANAAISAVRSANSDGTIDTLRDSWPPAHTPLIPVLKEKGQSIPVVCILDDGSIVARIGSNYQNGRTIHIRGNVVVDVPDVGFFGRGPNRRYFGVVRKNGIAILDGWQGPQVALCPWPNGTEDLPVGYALKAWDSIPNPTCIIPFPDGKKILMVSEQGIFVLSEAKARRLLPTKAELKEHFDSSLKKNPKEKLTLFNLSMAHGAVSKDGKLIAVGCQDSTHLVFDDKYEKVGNIGNQSEYPHHAVFSADQSTILFNSCHFYNGVSIGVPVSLLPGLKTKAYEEDKRTPILEGGARVYAAASRGDEFVIGDASGYIRAFDLKGNRKWEQFIGSSVGDIDISPDGKTLVVSTFAGFLSIFQLDAGSQAPHQIGNGNHYETRRWIFWKNEKKPLIW